MLWEEAFSSVAEYVAKHSSKEDSVLREINKETANLFPDDYSMLSGHPQGLLLELIATIKKPMYILEVGTFVGYSTICLARGLQENGRLITIEKNKELENLITKNLKNAGVEDKVLTLFGDAMELIPELPYSFDLAFIDADKIHYPDYVQMVENKMTKGGVLLVDNTLWGGEVLNPKTPEATAIHKTNEYLASSDKWKTVLVPMRDGIKIAQFVG